MWLGIGLGFAFLLLASMAAYWSSAYSLVTFKWVEHTQQVLDDLNSTRAAILDVETGARGFVITGNEDFLQPFNRGRERVGALIQTLKHETSDNSDQQKSLSGLEALVAAKISFSTNIIYQRKAGRLNLNAETAPQGAEKEKMDAIRQVLDRMESTERALLAQRSTSAKQTFYITRWVISFTGALALVVIGAAGLSARRDLIKRRQAEKERDRFFTLSLDLFCIAGFDGYFKRLNAAWEKNLGHTQAEFRAKPFIEFVHPEDRESTLRMTEKLNLGQAAVSFANRYLCKDGSYRWLLWNAAPQMEQKVIYATARDVTEEKRAEQEIQLLNESLRYRAKQLEQVNEELEAFSYSVSHDLRAPLRHIDGFASRLQQNFENSLDEKGRRYLNIISGSAKQMGNLIDDLLLFSRMGRTEMQEINVNLETLARKIVHDPQLEISKRNITWDIGRLPEVRGDIPMLRQAFLNLISNAVKYTRTREHARIEIGSTETTDEFIIFVRDNGVGFEMEYAHKLFGVFQRLHRADEFEGTGIGLANVRRIIQRHGGRTWAEGK
jgi:PAS domain S-box-containing protein